VAPGCDVAQRRPARLSAAAMNVDVKRRRTVVNE
jgi:hypothetical protein